jgi:hypothetical protein
MSLDAAVAPDITLTFGVPIMIQTVPGAAPVNEGLKRASPGKSNCDDWHSNDTLPQRPEPQIAAG